MILEVAVLRIRPGQSARFEGVFAQARSLLAAMPGYLGHELQHCLEVPDKYVLLVRWRSVEDHEIGFRGSPQYQEWKRLLHHFYDPFPVVEHFELVERGDPVDEHPAAHRTESGLAPSSATHARRTER